MNPCIGMLFKDQDREDVRIEGIGWDWFVGRNNRGETSFYTFDHNIQLLTWLNEHMR